MDVPKLDKLLGIEVYATKTAGVGGAIRKLVEDFVVEEVLVDGSKAAVENESDAGRNVLGASSSATARFLLCVLVKRNWDMIIAIRNVAKQLGIDQERISVAGIKDAKAVTAQHITIENASIKDIGQIHIKDVNVRPVGYFHSKLTPYYLLGNNFTINIKDTDYLGDTEAQVKETFAELEKVGGMPNFFGHQRFGTTRPITHLVGQALVRGHFKEAVMRFLAEPSPYEHPASRQARSDLQEKQDFKQALRDFPLQLRYERFMLRHLVDSTDDFVGAFRRLPIKLQMLFVQAYQSYLFNRFLSRRLKKGVNLDTAEVGDFVINIERSGLPMIKTGKIVTTDSLANFNELIKRGKMRVALPLVGAKQKFSGGEAGAIQKQILSEENIEPKNFWVTQIPEISGRGELRAVVSPPKNFMLQKILGSNSAEALGIQLSFMLLRGSYATILLREIIKPPDPVSAGF